MRTFVIFGMALIALCIQQISDPDIWFYLVVARESLQLGQIPAAEFYVYPALGEPAHFSAFGFGLIHYLMYQLAGTAGMAILNALLCGGALWILLLAARQATRGELSPWLGLLPIAIAYALAEFRMSYRPETTLFLFLAIELLLLERWLAEGNPRLLAGIPVLALLLAQLHTTTVFIWAIYLMYAIHWSIGKGWQLLRQLETPVRIELTWLFGCGALSLLLPLINPFGHAQLTILFQSLTATLSAPADNLEYMPILITDFRYHFIALAGILAIAWGANPERRWVDLMLMLAFGWLAYRYVRNFGLFALVAVIPLSLSLARLHQVLAERFRSFHIQLAAGLTAFAIIGGTAQASGNWGIGLRTKYFPIAGAAAIRQNSATGNILNFFHHGSYLAWTLGSSYKVAIDGHFVTPTKANEYHDSLLRADSGWEQRLERDKVVAIVSPATLPFTGQLIPLIEKLATDPRWVLAAVDPQALTFLPAQSSKEVFPKAEIWRQVLREVDIVVKDNPNTTHAYYSRARAEEKLSLRAEKRPRP